MGKPIIPQNEARRIAQKENRKLEQELARNTVVVGLRKLIEASLKSDDSHWHWWVKEIQSLNCWEFVIGGDNFRRNKHTVISVNMYSGEVKSFKR